MPRGSLPCKIPFSTLQVAAASAGLLTSFQRLTSQPLGTPSCGNNGANLELSSAVPTATLSSTKGIIATLMFIRIMFSDQWSNRAFDLLRKNAQALTNLNGRKLDFSDPAVKDGKKEAGFFQSVGLNRARP